MERRVVITGLGAVTPVGNDVPTFWENIKAGKHGIGPITHFDASDLKVSLAAEVKDFDPKDYLDRKEYKRMDPYSWYGIVAAQEAMRDAGLEVTEENEDNIGVNYGTGIGGIQEMQTGIIKVVEKGPSRLNPLFVPMAISNMGAANISLNLGTKGGTQAHVTACASANNAIGEAYRAVKHGYYDYMLAGGGESAINLTAMAGFENLTALNLTDDADRASIPFDNERAGFVMGEGAGILVLESYDSAKARGAKIYAEIVGYGANSDAYHLTAPTPDGSGAGKAMLKALDEAGLKPEDVDYINAHGTSTPANDSAETKAIKYALGEEVAKEVAISSTKSVVGHLLGGAGAVEAIAVCKAIQEQIAPPTANLRETSEDCDLDYIPNEAREMEINVALSNNLGFGGHNTILCFKKVED